MAVIRGHHQARARTGVHTAQPTIQLPHSDPLHVHTGQGHRLRVDLRIPDLRAGCSCTTVPSKEREQPGLAARRHTCCRAGLPEAAQRADLSLNVW